MKEGFVFDEKKHLYFYDGKPMTGCTTILGVLAKPALIPWAAKMAVEYIAQHGTSTPEGNRFYLLNVFRQKLAYPDLKRALREQDRLFRPQHPHRGQGPGTQLSRI
jgi:hypothetical protein